MKDAFFCNTAGGSMRPFLKGGRPVLVAAVAPDRLRAGDVVLYEIDGKRFIHRIWKVSGRKTADGKNGQISFCIGDDGAVVQPHTVPAGQIIGKVISVPDGYPGLLVGIFLNGVFRAGRCIKEAFFARRCGIVKEPAEGGRDG